ncbi:MAG: MarR family transcriptional regulator [Actinomycetota bacterium]|nr:MarR family transcriptional regulator [Actinomycetota bacterium]
MSDSTNQHTSMVDKLTKSIELMMSLLKEWEKKSTQQLQAHGITFAQFRAIMVLYENGSQTLTQLSKSLQRAKCSMTGLVDRLEKKELVGRMRSIEDRRKVLVFLTHKGESLARKLEKEIAPLITDSKTNAPSQLSFSQILTLYEAVNRAGKAIGMA